MVEQQGTLGAQLGLVKSALLQLRREDLVQSIDDAMAAGSTSLEIHYRLLGALQQMRPELKADAEASGLVGRAIETIEHILHGNS